MSTEHWMVVGGTRGIGRVLVQSLAGLGHRVSVLGRDPGRLADAPNLWIGAVDVTDALALQAAIDAAVTRFGCLRRVVFLQRHRGPDDDFDRDLAVALGATRAIVDHIVGRGYFDAPQPCSMVMVSSVADEYVAPEQPAGYHVAKAGLAQLARYYALTFGPAGVRVNTVSPCVVLKPEAAEYYDRQAQLTERFRTFIPLGRMGTAEDIVNAILFLSSDNASYITGQNLVVDGGLTLRSHESMLRDVPQSERS